MTNRTDNPYLSPGMPMSRVVSDAKLGVGLAREAWRRLDPAAAARALGAVVEPPPQPPDEAAQRRRDWPMRTTLTPTI